MKVRGFLRQCARSRGENLTAKLYGLTHLKTWGNCYCIGSERWQGRVKRQVVLDWQVGNRASRARISTFVCVITLRDVSWGCLGGKCSDLSPALVYLCDLVWLLFTKGWNMLRPKLCVMMADMEIIRWPKPWWKPHQDLLLEACGTAKIELPICSRPGSRPGSNGMNAWCMIGRVLSGSINAVLDS